MSQAPIHSCLERQRPLLKDLKYCIFEENCPCCYILSHWIDSIPGVKRWSCTANYDQKRQQAPIGNCWFSSWKPRWSTEEAATTTSCRWATRYVGHSSQQSHCVLAGTSIGWHAEVQDVSGFRCSSVLRAVTGFQIASWQALTSLQHYHHQIINMLPSFGNIIWHIFPCKHVEQLLNPLCYGVGLPQTHCFQQTAGRPCNFGCWPAPQFLPKAPRPSWCELHHTPQFSCHHGPWTHCHTWLRFTFFL